MKHSTKLIPKSDTFITNLTKDQAFALSIVENHLTSTLEGHTPTQLLMIIQGKPGTGKAEVIRAIADVFKSNGKEDLIVRSAHTAAASAIIGGRPLSALIPLGLLEPDTEALPEGIVDHAVFWKDALYLIVNEIGMMSKTGLCELENTVRLARKIAGIGEDDEPFGGLNVILVGDFYQYPSSISGSTPLWTIDRPEDTAPDIRGRTIYQMFETVGHERSLTQIKFNRDGDLLFTASKDHVINVWFSHNGERLGTYSGNNGSVWSVDVDSSSEFMVSGAADNTMRLWEVRSGKCVYTWEFPTAVKRVAFSQDDKQVVLVTEQRMGFQGAITIFNINREDPTHQSSEPTSHFNPVGSKATMADFAPVPSLIITGHESGKVAIFDSKTGEEVDSNERAHSEPITDLQMSSDRSYFITASKDKCARLHDTRTLAVLKTYTTETPLNSAAIAPHRPFVLIGGGQDAMSVTTTSTRQGKFETRFWHKVFEEEVGRVKGHFGPINTIAVHPSGKAYASGGEDGFVRLHHYDESYFTAKPYGAVGELDDD
ncbi:translation initiation factor eIF3 subunit [Tulasnella sp. 332]|nr:translation initiation factor eIF3 subunit [Tulasnella sp. 332]